MQVVTTLLAIATGLLGLVFLVGSQGQVHRLVVGVILSETGTLPIGNWAHGGGAAWGLVAGVASGARWRRIGVPALALATAGLAAWAATSPPLWLR